MIQYDCPREHKEKTMATKRQKKLFMAGMKELQELCPDIALSRRQSSFRAARCRVLGLCAWVSREPKNDEAQAKLEKAMLAEDRSFSRLMMQASAMTGSIEDAIDIAFDGEYDEDLDRWARGY
jgi:hypothetical protein